MTWPPHGLFSQQPMCDYKLGHIASLLKALSSVSSLNKSQGHSEAFKVFNLNDTDFVSVQMALINCIFSFLLHQLVICPPSSIFEILILALLCSHHIVYSFSLVET